MDLSKFIETDIIIRPFPYRHAVVENFFRPEIYESLKDEFNSVLVRGLSETYSPTQFVRFPQYDAYCYLPEQNSSLDGLGVRSFFYSRVWKEFIEKLFGRSNLTDEVLLEYHYHKPYGEAGEIHSDNEEVNFLSLPKGLPGEFIKAFNQQSRAFRHEVQYRGESKNPNTIKRRRAIVAILYLNDNWIVDDGGQTALYEFPDKDPITLVEPKGNTLLLFEIGSTSWHRSLALGSKERKTICFWFHS